MVLDTSAVLALLLGEEGAAAIAAAIEADPRRLISAATALECALVIEARKGPPGGRELDLFLHATGAEVVPFTAEQLALARDAWRRFGQGRHPAALNFGDCFSFALSKLSGEPLLFRGDGFSRTEVASVGDA